jgi:glycosyltransferase involved in cell wall biosynthesis
MKSTRGVGFAHSLGVEPARVFLVPHVVDNEFFSTRARRASRSVVREAWGIPEGVTVALFVGKLVPWKRPGDLIDAIAQIPDVWAVFVGEGELRSQLEDHARRLGVEGRLQMHGFANQQELPSLYAAADVLVLPSQYEPFGLVVNEAFAVGTPAIVTDACGAAGDLVRQGVTGYIYRVGSIEDLASRLGELDADPTLRRKLGEAGHHLVESAWGPHENVDGFANACVSCLQLPSHPVCHR